MAYKSPLEGAYEESRPSSYEDMYQRNNLWQRYAHNPYDDPHRRGRSYQSSYSDYHRPSSSHQKPTMAVARYSDRNKPSTYPRELTRLFGASKCMLCEGVDLLSPIVAKMHYSGKPHLKKVKQFLTEWSERTGAPMPEVQDPSSDTGSSLSDYCELCDVKLISMNDKILHYSGKNHRKNLSDPDNPKRKRKAYETLDLAGRFGIGQSFATEKTSETDISIYTGETEFTCEICDVKAVSQDQLNQHLSGKKHKEKLEKKELDAPKKAKRYPCDICNVSLDTGRLLKLHLEGKRHKKALVKREMDIARSSFCNVCNLSFTSLEHYQSHVSGKKHEKNLKFYNNKVNGTKSSLTCEFCPFVGNLENHVCDKPLTKLEFENLEEKWVCTVCFSMVFNSEQEYNEHKQSSRHIICVLNGEGGDKMKEEFKHWYCILCKKQCYSCKEYTDHFFEDRHLRLSEAQANVESNPNLFRCSVCELTLTEELKQQHLRSRDHIKKALHRDTLIIISDLANKDINAMMFRCDDCHTANLNFKEYSEHILGESHMEILISAKLARFS